MTPLNNTNTGGLSTFTVKVAGSSIPDSFNVRSIRIEKKVNCITAAKIVIVDGDASTGNFEASSSSVFVPGAEISVEAGYDSTNASVFKGIITGQAIKVNEAIGSTLDVICHDAAIKMTVGPKSKTFTKKSDNEIILSTLAKYPDFSADVASTDIKYHSQVQYGVTDWDFILARASTNGMLVTTLDNKVTVASPGANISSIVTVSYGDSLLEFHATLNAVTQLAQVKASAWDYKNQAINLREVTNDMPGPGNLSSARLGQLIGLAEYSLKTTAPLTGDELTQWAKAEMLKSEYSKITGKAKFQGTSLVNPGVYITLDGLGDRFNGDHFVSAVVHEIAGGHWLTEVAIGISADWIDGTSTTIKGLFNGTVKQIDNDPEQQFRILVDIPLFGADSEGIWARLSNFYSTNGAGAFFLPEVGDEVVLGFLNDDPRFPVILGSMYSANKKMPNASLTPDQKNSTKAIISKSGISLAFNDEKKVLTIATPGGNTITMSDEGKTVTIGDDNKNSIIMSKDGIVISSAKNITLDAPNIKE